MNAYNQQKRPHAWYWNGERNWGQKHAQIAKFDWKKSISVFLVSFFRWHSPFETSVCSGELKFIIKTLWKILWSYLEERTSCLANIAASQGIGFIV